MMSDLDPSDQNTSLEEHLTNSIRRAKERIYNNAITNYSQTNQFSLSQQQHNTSFEVRNRANSQRNAPSNGHHRQQRNVLASAMRTLQEKIAMLERENKQLRTNNKQSQQMHEYAKKIQQRQQKQDVDLAKLVSRLRDKQQEIKKINRQNRELSINNANLASKNGELEEEIQRIVSRQLDFPSESHSSEDYKQRMEANTQTIHQLQQRIMQQDKYIKNLQLQSKQKQQNIDQLTKKLDYEKKVNLRWIKMHEAQIGEADQKQNNSLQSNAQPHQQPAKVAHQPKKQEMMDLIKKNKEMYDSLQRNKSKISELTRQCKQYEQRFTQMKLIALQIVENVNKVFPNQGSHIKYLSTKILKLQNNHMESLRSFSNHSRKSRIMQRNSNSKQRKRSLKMQDLNSSAKKSREGSHSKSHKKRQPIDEPILRSQKKAVAKEEEQLEELEKEVQTLMKRYRNFVTKGEKDKNNDQINKKIEETAKEYNQKKLKFQQLKKQYAGPVKQKKELTHN